MLVKAFSFIARMPDDPGALHRAAEIIKSHGGNIHRVDYDRRIDPHIVFFQVDADEGVPEKITHDLQDRVSSDLPGYSEVPKILSLSSRSPRHAV